MSSYVNLGPYADRARSMVLSNDIGDDAEFSVAGFVLVYDDQHVAHQIVTAPFPLRVKGAICYSTVFGGCMWYYKPSSKRDKVLDQFRLRDTGEIHLVPIDWTESNAFRSAQEVLQRGI